MPGFTALAGRLQPLAAVRNLLAHEYLDQRFGSIARFVDEGAAAVGELAQLTRSWTRRDESDA